MLILMLVTLYTSRVVLRELGDAQYGIWNLIAGMVVLFSFVQNSMSTAIQRYLNYYIGKNNTDKTLSIFYNSKTIHYYLSLCFFIIAESIGLLIVFYVLNIPAEYTDATHILYHIIVLNTILLIIRIPYQAWIIAQERMSFFAVTGIIEGALNLLIVFILQFLPGEKLINYGVMTVLVSISLYIWFCIYCRRHWSLKILHCEHDKSCFRDLISFSGYTLMGSFSNVGASQGVNLLINMFYGVLANTAMGIAQQVNGAIQKFITNFQTAFKPQIVKLYSSDNRKELDHLILKSSRMSFFMMWVLACPILFNTEYILELWLGYVPKYAPLLCILMICCSLLECLSSPLWMTIQATGKIKTYQIVISLTHISIVIWSYICFIIWQNIYSALIIKLVIDVVILIERLCFSKRLYNFDIMQFFKSVIIKLLGVVVISICGCTFIYLTIHADKSFIHIIIETIAYSSFCIICILLVGMTKNELQTIKNKINEKIQVWHNNK